MQPRPPQSCSRYVDERPHRQDTRPAFVPGTVWGTASIQNLQVAIGAVLTRKSGRQSPLCPPSNSDPLLARARPSASLTILHYLNTTSPCSRSETATERPRRLNADSRRHRHPPSRSSAPPLNSTVVLRRSNSRGRVRDAVKLARFTDPPDGRPSVAFHIDRARISLPMRALPLPVSRRGCPELWP